MKIRWIVAMTLVLLMGGALPASAQMMGGGGGMMEMMGQGMHGTAATGCPGMAAEPAVFADDRPWISFALAHASELGLTPDQVKELTGLREDFQKQAVRLGGEIRAAEAWKLRSQRPADLQAAEAKIRAIAGLEADLRIARLRALEKGQALLTPEQRQKLTEVAGTMGRMRGAFMMGGPRQFLR